MGYFNKSCLLSLSLLYIIPLSCPLFKAVSHNNVTFFLHCCFIPHLITIFTFFIPYLCYRIFYIQQKIAELCFSSENFNPQLLTLFCSDFSYFSAFILSHPLYFSYLIFFSPYLLRLLSFLSPLFVTTSLLLLLGLVHDNSTPILSEPQPSFLLSTFHVIKQRLWLKFGYESQEFHYSIEEFEMYKFMFLFENSTANVVEHPVGEECLQVFEDKVVSCSACLEVQPVCEVEQTKGGDLQFMEEKRLQDLFEVLDDIENNVDEKAVDPLSISTNSIKVAEEYAEESKVKKASEAKDNIIGHDNAGEYSRKTKSHDNPFYENGTIGSGGDYTSTLGIYGSMRREREWKRTLAGKLFEERHNIAVGGDGGIDSLWEAYESEDFSRSMRMTIDKKNNSNHMKKGTKVNFPEAEDDEEEEFEITNVQLCCLQAFKFSAGKMNLGMKKPNLIKFSKALKGIGWLHRVKRHGKETP